MRLLMPIGVLLIVVGMAGSVASCYGNSIFDSDHTATVAAQLEKPTDSPAGNSKDSSPRLFMAGDQNCSISVPACVEISTPSSPPSRARATAAA